MQLNNGNRNRNCHFSAEQPAQERPQRFLMQTVKTE
jgi:hypothetical protein